METKVSAETVSPDIFATIPKEDSVAFVLPLYGFTKDSLVKGLSAESLQVALFRLRSFFHKAYYIFVAEKDRIDERTLNILIGMQVAGNVKGIEVESKSTFGMYLEEGMRYALDNTSSKYIVCASPWIMIGKDSVDVLLERVNRIDVAVCSAFDVKKENVQPADFDSHKFVPVQEFINFDLNLFGFTKQIGDTITFDPRYKTKEMLQQDIFQVLHSRNQNVITSQGVPVYSFDVDWSLIEGKDELDSDREYFKNKWGFYPAK
jgi:hypothetical protein